MSLFEVLHHTNNGGDFHWLHSKHVVEAADEEEAKKLSLAHVDTVHKYNDSTRPNFTTSVSTAPAGAVAMVSAVPADTVDDKEGE